MKKIIITLLLVAKLSSSLCMDDLKNWVLDKLIETPLEVQPTVMTYLEDKYKNHPIKLALNKFKKFDYDIQNVKFVQFSPCNKYLNMFAGYQLYILNLENNITTSKDLPEIPLAVTKYSKYIAYIEGLDILDTRFHNIIITIYDLENEIIKQTLKVTHSCKFVSAELSHDNKYLAIIIYFPSQEYSLFLLNLEEKTTETTLDIQRIPFQSKSIIKISQDNNYIAIGFYHNFFGNLTTKIMNIKNSEIRELPDCLPLEFSPDNNLLILSSPIFGNNVVWQLDNDENQEINLLEHSGTSKFTSDGKLAIGSAGRVSLCDPKSKKIFIDFEFPESMKRKDNKPINIAISNNDRKLAMLFEEKILVWDFDLFEDSKIYQEFFEKYKDITFEQAKLLDAFWQATKDLKKVVLNPIQLQAFETLPESIKTELKRFISR